MHQTAVRPCDNVRTGWGSRSTPRHGSHYSALHDLPLPAPKHFTACGLSPDLQWVSMKPCFKPCFSWAGENILFTVLRGLPLLNVCTTWRMYPYGTHTPGTGVEWCALCSHRAAMGPLNQGACARLRAQQHLPSNSSSASPDTSLRILPGIGEESISVHLKECTTVVRIQRSYLILYLSYFLF